MFATVPRPVMSALAGLALVVTAHAQSASLQIDGRTSVRRLMGSQFTVSVNGAPNAPVALLIDVSPGPVALFGEILPLGFTPALFVLPIGNTDGNGDLSISLQVPVDPASHELRLYFLASVLDPSGPTLGFSNGADMTLLDRNIELAGNALSAYPHFDYVRAFNRGDSVELAVDPGRFPVVAGQTANVYIVASKTKAQWIGDPSLVDVAGGPQALSFSAGTIQANTFTIDTGTLAGPDETPGSGDTRLGVGYDIVIDLNGNGSFDAGVDLIDGYHATEAGFYVVRDTAAGATPLSSSAGPMDVNQIIYTGGAFLGQVTFYPTNIASMGQLPLVVVSHGNGHDYQWYDHIGYRMASYGYVVMSHQNETGPGSGTASQSTIANTEFLFDFQNVIGGGVLNGHLDSSKIVWVGHSRGADGVARAYNDLFNGVVTPRNFSINSIKLVDSIAPVDFGGFAGKNPILAGTSGSHPENAVFHLWVGESDTDVNGCAVAAQVQYYHLHERATGIRQSTSLYGAGHGDFHNAFMGAPFAAGPELIGRDTTHLVMLGYMLPLIKHYVEGDVAARDYLWRQYETFHPPGVPVATTPGLIANLMFQDDLASGKFVIDDFQDVLSGGVVTPTPAVASSGAPVTRTTPQYLEGSLDDNNTDFSFNATDPFNGFTMDDEGGTGPFRAESFGSVFTVANQDVDITYDLSATQPRFCDWDYLSFRAAQSTRHPFTAALGTDLVFTVTLEDGNGTRSSIRIDAYGEGIEQPYQRTGCAAPGAKGPTAGWNNEFETIRIRLTDFLNNGSGLDLCNISKLIFQFGPSFGAARARLGLDEIELTKK